VNFDQLFAGGSTEIILINRILACEGGRHGVCSGACIGLVIGVFQGQALCLDHYGGGVPGE
jgi:hypothetical protein